MTPKGFVKLNFDGSFLGNPGKMGIGGIIRDYSGTLRAFFQICWGGFGH